jgi:hypothetical protein
VSGGVVDCQRKGQAMTNCNRRSPSGMTTRKATITPTPIATTTATAAATANMRSFAGVGGFDVAAGGVVLGLVAASGRG